MKTVWIALLLVVVAVGVWLVVRAVRGPGLPPLPPEVLAQKEEKIDKESYEIVTLSKGDWDKLGYRNGKYKNPKTGKYTMVTPMTCGSCGAKIPMPDEPNPGHPDPGKWLETISKYVCPKCGKPAGGGRNDSGTGP